MAADVLGYDRSKLFEKSRAVRALDQLERACRTHDKVITNCLWILIMLLAWVLFAEHFLVSKQTYEYDERPLSAAAAMVDEHVSRRMLHRVSDVLSTQCELDGTEVTIAPYVIVSGKPCMYRIVRLCKNGLKLVNPEIAVQGSNSGYCKDSKFEQTRRVQRHYPITVHSQNNPPVTFLELQDVCLITSVIDVLNNKW